VTGSVADSQLVAATMRAYEIEAVIHAGALHKPHIETYQPADFIAVNVQGTLNLLEESVAPGSKVEKFIFTSTTSLMISRAIRAGLAGGATKAVWITEDLAPLQPRNIYGVSKLSAEHLCRLYHECHGLPLIILRTARFFPEDDDMAHAIAQTEPNTKVNELLFRRLTVEDAAGCHIAALNKVAEIGFDTFIVSAKTPFREEDCEQLIVDAPAVVARYAPHYRDIYEQLGWTMFDSIDRVYVAEKLEKKLGFVCRTGFVEKLDELSIPFPSGRE
jgi:UDP-glucose 4-epimerase